MTMSSFFCWTQKNIFWRMLVTEQCLVAIDLHSIIKMLWKSMAAISCSVTSIFIYLFFFKYLIQFSVEKKKKKLLQVWNNLRHHFRVSHCFKRDKRRQKKACVFFTPLLLQLKHSLFICQKATSLLAFLILWCSAYYLDVVSTFFLRTLSVSKWLNSACSVMYVDYSLKSPKIAALCCLCQAWGDLGCTYGRARSFPPS